MDQITSERVALIRAAFFRYAAQRDRRNATAGVPVEQRGRFGGRVEHTGSGEFRDLSPRTITERAADTERFTGYDLNGARLARWAANRSAVVPTDRRAVPSDFLWALHSAGLLDLAAVDGVPGVVNVSPRRAVPTHATADHLTPAVTPDAATFTADRSERVGRASSEERYERVRDAAVEVVTVSAVVPVGLLGLWADVTVSRHQYGAPHVARVNVPADLVAATAADPGRWHTAAAHLSGRASRFLAAHGEAWPTPDAWNRSRSRYHSRPDRVAHRGTARVTVLSPVRYERKVSDATAVAAGVFAARTALAWHWYCSCGCADTAGAARRKARFLVRRAAAPCDLTPAARKGGKSCGDCDLCRAADARRAARRERTRCACEPAGWVGHAVTVFARPVRGERAAARAARAASGATGRRGPAVSPWNVSARNLHRTAARVAPAADTFEQILRTAALGVPLTFDQGTTVTVLDGSTVEYDGRAYPVREWSRRAALAGIDPAAIG